MDLFQLLTFSATTEGSQHCSHVRDNYAVLRTCRNGALTLSPIWSLLLCIQKLWAWAQKPAVLTEASQGLLGQGLWSGGSFHRNLEKLCWGAGSRARERNYLVTHWNQQRDQVPTSVTQQSSNTFRYSMAEGRRQSMTKWKGTTQPEQLNTVAGKWQLYDYLLQDGFQKSLWSFLLFGFPPMATQITYKERSWGNESWAVIYSAETRLPQNKGQLYAI